MKKKYKFSANLLLGILVGMGVSAVIFQQGNLIISYMTYENIEYNSVLINVICGLIAILSFVLVVKGFLSSRRKKLSMYFLLSVILSIVGSLMIWYLLLVVTGGIFTEEQIQKIINSSGGLFIVVNAAYLVVLVIIIAFVAIFMVLVNRKVKYIQYISEEVKKIEIEGFGRTLKVQGNDELSELSIGINTMSIKLKEKIEQEKLIEHSKNELITNVSHDLRTPLTSIIGYVTLLKQNGFENKDKFDEYMEVVERRLGGLNTLINELFEYTKLNSSELRLNYSHVNIIEILNHLINEYEIIYSKEELQIKKQIYIEECYMDIDVDKIIRVYQNIFDNARKYAVKGSVVQVDIYEEDHWLCMAMNNRTDQLLKVDTNRIFERFYKSDEARSESSSAGLGLSIVKRILDLHGGTIHVNVENDVVSFEVKLPILNL